MLSIYIDYERIPQLSPVKIFPWHPLVCNDIELRELLTSPSGATSHVLFAASSYLDIPASRAFDNPGSAPLDFPQNRWVEMVQSLPGDRGTRRLPRPQSSVLAALGFSPARVFPKDARF
ncbi:hypothetical protein HZ326_29305 [Fusarium oxysporum f. sp. albedinis]|nr:hypothetical protein HZ326_29305 [Fusarium oxysporum f. sp. albedinis]